METIFSVIICLEFIFLVFVWILTLLYSLSTDINTENRRKNQEKRDIEYHKARMKDLMR